VSNQGDACVCLLCVSFGESYSTGGFSNSLQRGTLIVHVTFRINLSHETGYTYFTVFVCLPWDEETGWAAAAALYAVAVPNALDKRLDGCVVSWRAHAEHAMLMCQVRQSCKWRLSWAVLIDCSPALPACHGVRLQRGQLQPASCCSRPQCASQPP